MATGSESVTPKESTATKATILSTVTSEVVERFRRDENDTGSPEVQVAVLTHRLQRLNTHFATHRLDHHSRQGLLKIVSKRKRLLAYLKGEDVTRYRALIKELGLRK